MLNEAAKAVLADINVCVTKLTFYLIHKRSDQSPRSDQTAELSSPVSDLIVGLLSCSKVDLI